MMSCTTAHEDKRQSLQIGLPPICNGLSHFSTPHERQIERQAGSTGTIPCAARWERAPARWGANPQGCRTTADLDTRGTDARQWRIHARASNVIAKADHSDIARHALALDA
jgi:hypothetical protein